MRDGLMRAASRESYAGATERLAAYGRDADPPALLGTADELFAVAALLAREPRLRRALSDAARDAQTREGLLRELFRGKLADPTLDLLAGLVTGRWSSATDLLTATELLFVDTLLMAAERAGELADVEDELFRFGQVVAGDQELAATLGDSSVPPPRRAELARALLDGKANAVTIRLAELAVHGFGGRGFAAGLTRLVELAAQRRERQVAYVTTAIALSDDEERRLGATLSELYGREVSMKLTVDPEILGGMSVQVGSDLYDGTVLRRLTETRNALTAR
jgi:F-type H+-transporting ATPase subunit delta